MKVLESELHYLGSFVKVKNRLMELSGLLVRLGMMTHLIATKLVLEEAAKELRLEVVLTKE